MIILEVEPYCQKCPDFEPTVDRYCYADNAVYSQIVQCENRERCRNIYETMKGEKDENTR